MKKIIVSLFLLTLLAAPSVALAQFQLFPGESAGANDYRIYIQNFYRFSIAAGILIATVLIMVGGIMWVTSAGDRGRVEKAMDYIKDSIIGVVLLIGAYTILSLINPNLVNLPAITFPELSLTTGSCMVPKQVGTVTGKSCIETTKDQCTSESVQPNKELGTPVFTENNPCSVTCPIRDNYGLCTEGASKQMKKLIAEQKTNGKSTDQIRCEAQGNFGQGSSIPESKGLFTTDNGTCETYCAGAGTNCVRNGETVDIGDNIICKCTYTGPDKK